MPQQLFAATRPCEQEVSAPTRPGRWALLLVGALAAGLASPRPARAQGFIAAIAVGTIVGGITGAGLEGVGIGGLAVNLRTVARAKRGGNGWVSAGAVIGALNVAGGATMVGLGMANRAGALSVGGGAMCAFGLFNIAAAIGAGLQPRDSAAPALTAYRLRHALRFEGEWGSGTAQDYGASLWGGVTAYYGFVPHRLFQLDVGVGLRALPSSFLQLDFHVMPRLVLSTGALRWLPGMGFSGGPSFTSSAAAGSVVARIEPLAMEIALTRAVNLFFAAGMEVGIGGTYCSACPATAYGYPGESSPVAGRLGGYQRMGVTYRF